MLAALLRGGTQSLVRPAVTVPVSTILKSGFISVLSGMREGLLPAVGAAQVESREAPCGFHSCAVPPAAT